MHQRDEILLIAEFRAIEVEHESAFLNALQSPTEKMHTWQYIKDLQMNFSRITAAKLLALAYRLFSIRPRVFLP